MKKIEYSSYEDVLLVQCINRHVDTKGVIHWKDMRILKRRDLKSMQNRWLILKQKHVWNGERYNIKHIPRKYEGTKKEKVEQYLSNNPDARPKDVCRDLNVNHNTVYAVRRNMRQEGLIPTKGNATPIADVVNTGKTPQNASTGIQKKDKPKTTPLNKRVKVSRSFFWGAVTVTKYE
tara:strand:+ start:377 stop:907 length:531 start_codon:yes stop_codon:yes gene_type:complete